MGQGLPTHAVPEQGRAVLDPSMDRLRRGDPREWDVAFTLLWPVAYKAAARMLGGCPRQDVEDIACLALRQVVERIDAVGTFTHLRSLARVLGQCRAMDYLRYSQAARRSTGVTDPLPPGQDLPGPMPSPSDEADAAEVSRWLAGALEILTERERELVTGFFLEGLTHLELADGLGIPIGSIGVTLGRALVKLRGALADVPELLKEFQERLRSP